MNAGKYSDDVQSPETVAEVYPWRRRHWQMLGIACGVALLATAMQIRTDSRVEFSAAAGLPLPPLCMSRSWFGVECPGCGLTRSFVQLAHGRWQEAWKSHRLGWLLGVSLLAQIPYRIACLLSHERLRIPDAVADRFAMALIILLIANWTLGVLGV